MNYLEVKEFIENFLEEVNTKEIEELKSKLEFDYETDEPINVKAYQCKEDADLELYLYTFREQFVIRKHSNPIDFMSMYVKSITYSGKEQDTWKRFVYTDEDKKEFTILLKVDKVVYSCNHLTPNYEPFYNAVLKGYLKDIIKEHDLYITDTGFDVMATNIWNSIELSRDKESFFNFPNELLEIKKYLNSIECANNFIEYCSCLTDISFILKHYYHISPIEDILSSNPTVNRVSTNDNFTDPFNVIHVDVNINLGIKKEELRDTILKNRSAIMDYLFNVLYSYDDIAKYKGRLKCDLMIIDNYVLTTTFGLKDIRRF